MIHRKIEKELNKYYENESDPILIINGARQIGKTYIIRYTAQNYFQNYIEINLKNDYEGKKLFDRVRTVEEFYIQVSSLYGDKLKNIKDTIIFLDEIQVYPHLLSMLKPLKQDNKYRYIASGSLLGLTLRHTFIPIGSIREVRMFPLDFEEYLFANRCGELSINYLRECFNNKTQVNESIHITMLQRFREYLIVGGLPEVVNEYIKSKNIYEVRKLQDMVYNGYKDDATQYDITNNLKIRTIYDLLPSYMENKVKRIQAKAIDRNVRADIKRYEDEFDFLIYSGVTLPTRAVSDPKFPLLESATKNLIKLYYNDIGILSSLLFRTNTDAIMNQDNGVNLGSLYETVCAMELLAHGHELYYFDSKKVGEVDFIINDYSLLNVLPIEIKSGKDQNNYRAIPKLVKEPYTSRMGYVFWNKNIIKEEGNIWSFPIYMIMFI